MTQLAHEGYHATKWRSGGKPRGLWGGTHDRPLDEENVPPNLDYKALEQIADGVEKMILSWSNREEREPYLPPCMRQAVESGISSPGGVARGLQKQEQTSLLPIKSPLSEKSFAEDGGCNYVCPVQIPEGPGGMTTEIFINGKSLAAGMGSSTSQTVRAESINSKDMLAEKSVTKTATYWYMESSNANNRVCPLNSREAEAKPVATDRAEGNESWETALVAPLTPSEETQQKSSNRRGSRHSRKKDILLKKNADGDQQPIITSNNLGLLKQDKSQVLETQTKLKDRASEVLPLPKVNIGNFDSLFDSIVIDDEVLEKKLAALTTMPPTPLLNPVELSESERNKQVQDLQIALLECAMEYELKTIELKMKINSLQSTPKHSELDSKSPSDKTTEVLYSRNTRESQIVESMKKQIFKLQRGKEALTKEYIILQKKERKFESQQRNLDDAILRVNRLTKEVLKKEHELMEAQLMEKQLRVQLQETEAALAKAEANQLPPQQAGLEPAKLVAALPSLREWIKNLKKDSMEPLIVKMVDGYYSPGEEPDHSDIVKPRTANDLAADNAHKVVEKVVHTLMKEVHGLQRELSRLGSCRTLRPKSAPLSGEFLKPGHLKKERSKR